jgi:RNA-directed DNA polymerase
MMYDHEKSDPAIVAVKPTNKAGQPAAELVEPRAGAEGNVSQQSKGPWNLIDTTVIRLS